MKLCSWYSNLILWKLKLHSLFVGDFVEYYVWNVIFTLKIEHKNILERGSMSLIIIIKRASLKNLVNYLLLINQVFLPAPNIPKDKKCYSLFLKLIRPVGWKSSFYSILFKMRERFLIAPEEEICLFIQLY